MAIIFLSIIFSCSDNVQTKEVQLISKNPITLNIQFAETAAEVEKIYRQIRKVASSESIKNEKIDYKKERLAFHYLKGNVSYIVMVKPSELKLPELRKTLGHEVLHVLFGEYHPASGKLPNKLKMVN